jgi:uncharacterized C2H2 Zn-finger protein
MKACASCPFTTDDETLTACPRCKQVLTPAPSPEEIARATAKIRAGWSRRKRAGKLAYPELPVEVTRAKEW